MKKILALVLTIVMVAAMAVPALAAGHKTPEIVVTSGNADGYNVAGSTIKYEITLADGDATSIKVGNKTLKISDFTENKDGSYTYKGTYTIGLTDTSLKFIVKDMDQAGDYEFEKTIKFKVDPSVPVVNASAITTGSAFKIGIISIIATDNVGLAKITVNGKTIADEDDIKGKKSFVINHDVAATGSYIIVVTDVAGNVSISTIKFNSDGTASAENVKPTVGGNLWNGGYLGGLASIYKDNPQLYYLLQNNGELDDVKENWWLWYYLSQGKLPTPDNSTITTNNWYFLYQYIMNNEDMSVADKQLIYALISGNVDFSSNNLYWYLLQNNGTEIDKTLLYYLLGGANGSVPSLDFKENYLAYEYFFGTLAKDLEITSNTKERVLTLTAPEVKKGSSASYTWKMYIDGSWKTVGSDSETLEVEPNVGDKYKVIISSDFSTVESDVYTVTEADKLPDFSVPEVEEDDDDDDDEDKFSSDDITINGVQNNYVRIKVGEKAYFIPNVNGYWTYDTEMFSGTVGQLAVLTAKKAGTTVILFTGINSKGETATRSIFVEVVE